MKIDLKTKFVHKPGYLFFTLSPVEKQSARFFPHDNVLQDRKLIHKHKVLMHHTDPQFICIVRI